MRQQRAREDHDAHKDNGGEKQTKHCDSGIAGSNGEGAFENEKLADKSVEPGQSERRKHDLIDARARQRSTDPDVNKK